MYLVSPSLPALSSHTATARYWRSSPLGFLVFSAIFPTQLFRPPCNLGGMAGDELSSQPR